LRIGYFITHYPYAQSFKDPSLNQYYPIGGAANVAYYLAQDMIKLGHEVSIFTTAIDNKTNVEKADHMLIYRYGRNFRIEKASFSYGLQFKSPEHDVDLVHLHFALPPGNLAAWHYAKQRKKPFVITYHGDPVPDYGNIIRRLGLKFLDKFIYNKMLPDANIIICPSEQYIKQSYLLSRYQEKAIAIPNGIDLETTQTSLDKNKCREALGLPGDKLIIFFLGNLISYKSPDLLIESLPLILKQMRNVTLVMSGDGPMLNDLENQAKRLNISDNVIFTGSVAGEQKNRYFKASDIFVLPSALNTEVFPIVLLEASAAALPMVVSNLPTMRCIIDNEQNGIIYNAGDINSLAEVIIRLLKDPELRSRLGQRAREKVENFTWHNIALETEKIYKQFVAE